VGKAKKLKALRRSLRENMQSDVLLQSKTIIKEVRGQHITQRIIRHDPNSLKGIYKKIKKQGDYGEDV